MVNLGIKPTQPLTPFHSRVGKNQTGRIPKWSMFTCNSRIKIIIINIYRMLKHKYMSTVAEPPPFGPGRPTTSNFIILVIKWPVLHQTGEHWGSVTETRNTCFLLGYIYTTTNIYPMIFFVLYLLSWMNLSLLTLTCRFKYAPRPLNQILDKSIGSTKHRPVFCYSFDSGTLDLMIQKKGVFPMEAYKQRSILIQRMVSLVPESKQQHYH